MTTSIIIPAHNEGAVIERCLNSFLPGADPGEFEVVVVCNGCRDDTADIARRFGPPVQVVETEMGSKPNALNLGDRAATAFPRIYMDADVVMSLESVRRLGAPLARQDILAAAPAVNTVFNGGADWSVRAYYRFWMALPFVQEGMMAAGVYALSEAGRARFGDFPEIISDDGFVRLHFAPGERVEVADAISIVTAPSRWDDLIRIKSRSRLGVYQLRERYADMFTSELKTKRYSSALLSIAKQPQLYLSAIPFIAMSVISRGRAQKQHRSLKPYVWERDHSSRA